MTVLPVYDRADWASAFRNVGLELDDVPLTASRGAIPAELKPAFEDIRKFREAGRDRRAKYLDLLNSGKAAAASDYLREDIYEAHRTFLAKLDAFCDSYQEQFARLNRELNDANNQSRAFLFGLSAVPIAIIAGGLLLVLAFMIVLFTYRPDIIVTPKGRE